MNKALKEVSVLAMDLNIKYNLYRGATSSGVLQGIHLLSRLDDHVGCRVEMTSYQRLLFMTTRVRLLFMQSHEGDSQRPPEITFLLVIWVPGSLNILH